MTDKEFKKLQEIIQKKMRELGALQLIHRQQTGRDFMLGQPIMDNSKERLWGMPKK